MAIYNICDRSVHAVEYRYYVCVSGFEYVCFFSMTFHYNYPVYIKMCDMNLGNVMVNKNLTYVRKNNYPKLLKMRRPHSEFYLNLREGFHGVLTKPNGVNKLGYRMFWCCIVAGGSF